VTEGAEPDPAERIARLRAEIVRHEDLYYGADEPELTDAQFDALFVDLRELEALHPELISADSPTQRVGGRAATHFAKVRHSSPMLSLQNAFDPDEIRAFDARVRRVIDGPLTYVCELKIDGLAISLTYRGGGLVQAATRGDGRVGEDVTPNLRGVASVPERIIPLPGLPERFEVRGEVYFPLPAFADLNREMVEGGRPPFMNPRNAAAGSVRQIDATVTASRKLSTYMYTLDPSGAAGSQWEVLENLAQMGFLVNPNRARFDSIEGVIDFHQRWFEHRAELDHQIDGVVVKVDRHDQQMELGFVTRSPRWAIALKYAAEQVETQVESIQVYVGRTGVLTPVAHLRPVIVGGVVVRNATLHNEQLVNEKGVYAGATVVVQRAGDVIPEVVSVLDPKPGWTMPERCPQCGGEVVREEPYVAHRCINPFCPAQRLERLIHFASRGAMNIDGLGPATLAQLIASAMIDDPSDLYALSQEQLVRLEHHALKSAQKLVTEIERSRGASLGRFLCAIGIPQVGEATAVLLASHFETLERIRAATAEGLQEVEGIGPSMASEIARFFSTEGGKLVDRLLAAGVRPASPSRPAPGGPLDGLRFVFTGSLETMSRPQAEARVRALGARTSSSISARTDYVVVGSEAGSKLERSRRLEIPILDEAAFLELLESHRQP